MTAYADELRRCQVKLFLRAIIDAGGNQCTAARACGVHRNTVQRMLHAAGYNSRRLKNLAAVHRLAYPAKPPVSETVDWSAGIESGIFCARNYNSARTSGDRRAA